MSVEKIKRHYISPPISRIESEITDHGRGKLPSSYVIEEFIWKDFLMPSYRVAIGEDLSCWAEDEHAWRNAKGVQTRFVEYRPTGRRVYDTSKPQKEAIVYEYRMVDPRTEKELADDK